MPQSYRSVGVAGRDRGPAVDVADRHRRRRAGKQRADGVAGGGVADQDPVAASGYVQEAFVRQLAAEAGFVFVSASEVNANPEDDKDHPFGVETLPPRLLTAPAGEPPDPDFDSAPFAAIGESDRMTLKFRKPE